MKLFPNINKKKATLYAIAVIMLPGVSVMLERVSMPLWLRISITVVTLAGFWIIMALFFAAFSGKNLKRTLEEESTFLSAKDEREQLIMNEAGREAYEVAVFMFPLTGFVLGNVQEQYHVLENSYVLFFTLAGIGLLIHFYFHYLLDKKGYENDPVKLFGYEISMNPDNEKATD
ncbi:MAG: hypothetical protein K0S20_595 [Patescibacteria group bacterium]|jgi:hypothetical protein|nr:hypothetical protein [Patescibacteria group bacterium]